MTTLPPICRALAMGLNEEFEKMKTPQEAAREYAETLWNRESTLEWDVSRDACKSRSERDLQAKSLVIAGVLPMPGDGFR